MKYYNGSEWKSEDLASPDRDGLLSKEDKATLDDANSSNVPGTLVRRDSTGAIGAQEFKTSSSYVTTANLDLTNKKYVDEAITIGKQNTRINNADLNTITATGNYYTSVTSHASLANNFPEGAINKHCAISVYLTGAPTKTVLVQQCITREPVPRLFIRSTSSSGTVFLPWREFAGTEVATTTTSGLMSSEDKIKIDSSTGALDSVTVKIPTDFPTLQSAVDAYSTRTLKTGATVTLKMDADFHPTSGISVKDGDYSRFIITSVDPIVKVDPTFTGSFIYSDNSHAPTLSCLVDMDDKGEEGYYIYKTSNGNVSHGCGVMNAGSRGLYVGDASRCHATGAIFTGSNNRNCWVTRASSLSAERADFSANKGGENAVYVSRSSTVTIEYAKITDAFSNAVVATRSWVTATGVDVSRAGSVGLLAERAGHIQAQYATASNCGIRGVEARHTGEILVSDADILNNAGEGIIAWQSSKIDATLSRVKGNQIDIRCIDGSFVYLKEAQTTNSTENRPIITDTTLTSFNTLSPHGVLWTQE